MDNNLEQNENIPQKDNGRDIARVSIFIIALVVFLYLLTIAVLPVYAR